MGIDITRNDIRGLLKDDEFKNSVLDAIAKKEEDFLETEIEELDDEGSLMDDKDLVKKITKDVLETFKKDETVVHEVAENILKKTDTNSKLKKALMKRALKDQEFRSRVIEKVLDNMS